MGGSLLWDGGMGWGDVLERVGVTRLSLRHGHNAIWLLHVLDYLMPEPVTQWEREFLEILSHSSRASIRSVHFSSNRRTCRQPIPRQRFMM